MKDSDQPTPSTSGSSSARFDQQLDEWLRSDLLGEEGSRYPDDAGFERMARAIGSAALAHDAGAAGTGANDRWTGLIEDVDWCLAAPLPLRSGEPVNFSAAGGNSAEGDSRKGNAFDASSPIAVPKRQTTAAHASTTSPTADEPSLQELAHAMLASGKAEPKRGEPKDERPEADRISEVKPVLAGMRPALKAPPTPATAPGGGRVVHLARPSPQHAGTQQLGTQQLGTQQPVSPKRAPQLPQPTQQLEQPPTTAASAAVEGDQGRPAQALGSQQPAPRETRSLNALWGALALAAAVTLGLQFARGVQGTAPVAANDVAATPNAANATAALAAKQTTPDDGARWGQRPAPRLTAPTSNEAAADVNALPRESELEDSTRAAEGLRAQRTDNASRYGSAGAVALADRSAPAAHDSTKGATANAESPLVAQNDARGPSGAATPKSRSSKGGSMDAPSPNAAAPTPAAEPSLRPAARSASLPPQPSVGVATGAIGMVLPGARACLAGQFEPSRANVVFGPDGRVLRVEISGPAAGTPAESCIAQVLSAARVGPFTEDSFSVRTTVRP